MTLRITIKRVYRWQGPQYSRGYYGHAEYSTSGSGSDRSNSSYKPRLYEVIAGEAEQEEDEKGQEKAITGTSGFKLDHRYHENLVINISSVNLSLAQLTELQKGLSFSPSSPLDSFLLEQELHASLDRFV